MVELVRIGDKIISRQQIDRWITRIFKLRLRGYSQQEVAQTLKVDRTFISRLESLGELRKGQGVAVLGFPVGNGPNLEEICQTHGVDWWFILNEKERLAFVDKGGLELFNEVMGILSRIRSYDSVIFMGSDKRVQLVEDLLDRDVIPIVLGNSPLTKDVLVNEVNFENIIKSICYREAL